MNKVETDIFTLEKEITSVESDALSEERNNAKNNYNAFGQEVERVRSQIPYPDVASPEQTAIDYEERDALKYKKSRNKPYWDTIRELLPYCDEESLYSGHVRTSGGNYYILDSTLLPTKTMRINGENVVFVNSDDLEYQEIRKRWSFPSDYQDVDFSRNIVIKNKSVNAVDVRLDRTSEYYSDINDTFLRNALRRNKDNDGLKSIIQTIQAEQDEIRMLPKDVSFVVQGCAGSGKTMVLLHRIRYWLRNGLPSGDYLILIPSNSFRDYLGNISKEFKISGRSTVPVQNYYRRVAGLQEAQDADISELVFPQAFLNRVYSKTFIRDCYRQALTFLQSQLTKLANMCDQKLKEIQISEKEIIEQKIIEIQEHTVQQFNDLAKRLKLPLASDVQSMDDLPVMITLIEEEYQKAQEKKKLLDCDNFNVQVELDDPRVLSNERIVSIRDSISQVQELIKQASIFTLSVHKENLSRLQKQWERAISEVAQEIIAEEKERLRREAARSATVFDGISLAAVQELIDDLRRLNTTSFGELSQLKNQKDNFDEFMYAKYEDEIADLHRAFEISFEDFTDSISMLLPATAIIAEICDIGTKMKAFLGKHSSDDASIQIVDSLKLFNQRTTAQQQAYCCMLLFNECKKRIKAEFGIKINNSYKHYSYLYLYCAYLMKEIHTHQYGYIYIDEAQDLSIAEIELIRKLNTDVQNGEPVPPIMNLFGDVNQVITEHGITNWDKVSFIHKRYSLNENFRNPNQITDYCNAHLPFSMKKVGVDFDPVNICPSVVEAVKQSAAQGHQPSIIVKDSYAINDVLLSLQQNADQNQKIFTVKEAKGLEFRDVIVIDRDMTVNERYIAYTRALVSLTVVHELPRLVNSKDSLILEGEEVEENL